MTATNGSIPHVIAGDGSGRLTLDHSATWRLLDIHGAILFHGFDADEEAFYDFASSFTHAFLTSPFGDRKTVNDHNELQTVTVGRLALGLHFEFGNSPLRPDLLWFYCRTPAEQGRGGETLICDGLDIFRGLSPSTQDVLAERRIRYTNYIPVDSFDAAFTEDPAIRKITGGNTQQWLQEHGDARIVARDERRVTIEYVASCLRETNDGTPYLSQNIFTEAYKKPSDAGAEDSFSSMVTWEDGEEIDVAIIDEIRHAAHAVTKGIRWRPRAFVLIDNNRVLHGRRATSDPRRDILLLSSFSERYAGRLAMMPEPA